MAHATHTLASARASTPFKWHMMHTTMANNGFQGIIRFFLAPFPILKRCVQQKNLCFGIVVFSLFFFLFSTPINFPTRTSNFSKKPLLFYSYFFYYYFFLFKIIFLKFYPIFIFSFIIFGSHFFYYMFFFILND